MPVDPPPHDPEHEWRSAATYLPDVYDELRRTAMRTLGSDGVTLQPTALVHEAYLKCQGDRRFRDRAHFRAVAAAAMRQILIDHARGKLAEKRGGAYARTCCELVDLPDTTVDLVALDDVLATLERLDARKARVVELRVFGGMTIDEVAATLDVSHMTVSSDWRFARAWLATELVERTRDGDSHGNGEAG